MVSRWRVLMTAYGCQPHAGSENFLGWSWVEAMAAAPNVELTVVTSQRNADAITSVGEIDCRLLYVPDDVRLPEVLPGQLDEVVRYLAFVKRAQVTIAELDESFDVAHHVSWTNVRTKSPAFSAGCPVVFGPVGGAQRFPWSFLGGLRPVDRALETMRNLQVALSQINPTTRRQISSAALVVASNEETARYANRLGAKAVELMSDVPSIGRQDFQDRSDRGERFELIWVGRLMPRKGLGLAIEAVRQAAASIDLRLTVVGDGADRGLLANLPEANFRVLGHMARSELDDLYRSSHALLYTSLRDSGGPPLAEAMSFGLPAVVIDHQGPELLGRGWTVGVQPGRPDTTITGLAAAIVRLAEDRSLYDRLSNAALEEADRSSASARAELALEWYARAASDGVQRKQAS